MQGRQLRHKRCTKTWTNLQCVMEVEEGRVKRLHNVWLQLSHSRKGKMIGPENKALMVRGKGMYGETIH